MSDARLECVLAALAEGASVAEAARRAGVSRCTVHYWCRTRPYVKRRVLEIRARVLLTASLHTC